MLLGSLRGVAACLAVLLVMPTLAREVVAAPAVGDRQTELKAREAFAAGRYEDALDLFAKLYAETLHPVYLRNIGRCHQKMRQPQKAIDAFQDYLAKSKKLQEDEKKEIDSYIHDMQALQEEQTKAAKASVPEAPPPALPPEPPPQPQQPPPQALLYQQQPPPAADQPHPFYTRWWFWTIVGAAVVGGVATAVVLSSGGGTNRPACPPGVTGGCQ
jgi:hypothetical protein